MIVGRMHRESGRKPEKSRLCPPVTIPRAQRLELWTVNLVAHPLADLFVGEII